MSIIMLIKILKDLFRINVNININVYKNKNPKLKIHILIKFNKKKRISEGI